MLLVILDSSAIIYIFNNQLRFYNFQLVLEGNLLYADNSVILINSYGEVTIQIERL